MLLFVLGPVVQALAAELEHLNVSFVYKMLFIFVDLSHGSRSTCDRKSIAQLRHCRSRHLQLGQKPHHEKVHVDCDRDSLA